MSRVARRHVQAGLLPIMSAWHNLREACKQMVLLEDHLNQPQKRCPDCIRKHFLTIEALFEEGISLDKGDTMEYLEGKPEHLRVLFSLWASEHDPLLIAGLLREIRKPLVKVCWSTGLPKVPKVASACPHRVAMTNAGSRALMKWLSVQTKRLGVSRHTYVVGGAVRNFIIDRPVKDLDLVIDSVAAGKDSDWLAKQLTLAIPARTKLEMNQYGVALMKVLGEWELDGHQMQGNDIEIANARTESYTDGGYKPTTVERSTIEDDMRRREFTFNTLMWRLHDLANGPDGAEILDLTGCGLKDLSDGFARCPSDPDKTFTDDPSRMVRAVKFLVKYGLKPDKATAASIKHNAHKLWQIPPGQLSNILINTFFRDPTGPRALRELDKLGLVDVIRDIAQKESAFREALANFASREAKPELLFQMLDLNLPVGRRLAIFDKSQHARIRSNTVMMDEREASEYLHALYKPELDNQALFTKHAIPPKGRGVLRTLAVEALINDPRLAGNKAALTGAVDKVLARGRYAAHSSSKCMATGCNNPPKHECKWAEGRARAWFCGKHWPGWKSKNKDDIDMEREVSDGEAGAKWACSAKRVAANHVSANAADAWNQWIAQPFKIILKHHKEFVSGPVDDAVDLIISELAPKMVKAIGEREVEEEVGLFMRGAEAGRLDALQDGVPNLRSQKDEDARSGYAWGFAQAHGWGGGKLPRNIYKQVVEEAVRKYRHRVTEEVLETALRKGWAAINPLNTAKAMIAAAKKHGWKLGVGIALFELFEHFVVPSVLVALTGNSSLLALSSLPFSEIIYAVALRIMGRTHKGLDNADPDGHLDWYEDEFGPVRIACLGGS